MSDLEEAPSPIILEPEAVETARIPRIELLFAYGPVLLIVAAGAGCWLLPPLYAGASLAAGVIWASAILAFLAGVTRGLSFFTAGGPQRGQLAEMMWLYVLAFGSMIAPTAIALVLLVMGYATIALYDPQAAKRGWAPAHFARLRLPQMIVAIVGLLVMLARLKLGA
ncbi:DUF3429 domain-containing protein [Sphingomonas nostoxanthinifaciens]|uniref:DUF3429 domain-containing protein n=1 Tax=Sphingomonas nostoxanthinifaciens TaxID=2872652 RepID=UPI001CC1E511|nr:DUF3429 domain-containing protein [Sphingomonas nostoxanthinifaciens]UAK25388.1 DUF3429 domain-containing protein [Sphingomonas nostoxanthinifaciens]